MKLVCVCVCVCVGVGVGVGVGAGVGVCLTGACPALEEQQLSRGVAARNGPGHSGRQLRWPGLRQHDRRRPCVPVTLTGRLPVRAGLK